MGLDWRGLVEERCRWVEYNFPNDIDPNSSTLGVIEELGELAHSHLKEEQSIRGTAEEHQQAAQDSIADLVIYLWGIMADKKVFPEDHSFIEIPTPKIAIQYLAIWVGKLNYWLLAGDPEVDLTREVSKIVALCQRYCHLRGWNFDEIVLHTWEKVKLRDWQQYPDTGLPHPTSAVAQTWDGPPIQW